MKHQLNVFIAMLLFCLFGYAQQNYYVSNSLGNDVLNSGTSPSLPFKTIKKALESFDSSFGGTCYVLEGTYHEEIVLDSKTNINILPYNNATVVIDGTESLANTGWIDIGNGRYELLLPEGLDIWQLFIDDERQVMARWPNAQFYDESVYDKSHWAHGLDRSTNGIMRDDGALGNSGLTSDDLVGALAIANIGSFRTWVVEILTANVASNEFTYQTVSANGYRDNHQDYFLEGKLAFLDTVNEWHFDQITNKLVVYGNPVGKKIQVKTQDYFLTMNGVSNITIDGLNFFGTTVKATSSHDITIKNTLFSYPSCSRRMLGSTSYPFTTELSNGSNNISNFTFYKCAFEHTDGEAFYIEGGDNTIEDCYIHHIDYSCGSLRNLGTTIANRGDNCTFKNNTIFTTGASSTLSLADFPKVSYNNISNTGLLQNDGSMIQITKTAVDGSEVHHNWLHDSMKSGMRYDAPSTDPTVAGINGLVHHNVIWNTGKALMIKGNNQKVYNNTCFNNTSVSVTILDEEGSNLLTLTKNNLADQISGERNDPVAIPGTIENNVYSATASAYGVADYLTDPDSFDFTPKATATQIIDQGQIISGITTSSTPDIGAYNVGDTWVAGSTWIPDFYPWGVADIPTLKIETSAATEGESLSFKISLSNPIATDVTMTLAVQNKTAEVNDYVNPTLQFTIPANNLSKSFTITTIDDIVNESNESIEVSIESIDSTNASLLIGSATGIILDNDAPAPTLRNGFVLNPTFENTTSGAFDNWSYKGSKGIASISSDVSIVNSGVNSAEIEVNTTGGQGGVKLVGTPYSFAGNGVDEISVTVTYNMKVETVDPTKRVKTLIRNAASGATVSSRSNQFSGLTTEWQTFTTTTSFPAASNYELYVDLQFGEYPGKVYVDHITSTVSGGASLSGGETVPNVILDNAQAIEGTELSIPVSLDNITTEAIVLTVTATNISTDINDYSTASVQVTIPAGETTTSAIFTTLQDVLVEGDETFSISLSSVDAGTVDNTNDTAIATIIDDDIITFDSPISRNGFVLNPSFEETPEFSQWNYSGSNGMASLTNDVSVLFSGANALEIDVVNTGKFNSVRMQGEPYSFVGNNVDRIDIVLTMRMKVETVSPGKAVKMMIRNDETGAATTSRSKQFTGLTTEWQEFVYTTNFAADENYQLYLDLQFGQYPGKVYVDHITTTVSGGATLTGDDTPVAAKNAGKKAKQETNVNLEVYPNPLKSDMTIVSAELLLKTVSLYNEFGVLVLQKDLSGNSETLNVEDLKVGVYVAFIQLVDGTIERVRIVKL